MKGLLKTWLWMLALSLAVGLAIGTCVRRDAEQPATFIGGVAPDPTYEKFEIPANPTYERLETS
ncbi:MAG: hypothetical protein JRH10_04045 [Deltaproteobacteria bacterium]|nr:hypothetical protein [Deltaproteobacteria bacterium]MBW2446357.1 hypothetical protein [Deltaproteobacteria bacterium]